MLAFVIGVPILFVLALQMVTPKNAHRNDDMVIIRRSVVTVIYTVLVYAVFQFHYVYGVMNFSRFLGHIRMEHIRQICSSKSQLFFLPLCSIRTRSRNRDIFKKLKKNHYPTFVPLMNTEHERELSLSRALIFTLLSIGLLYTGHQTGHSLQRTD